eukprot:1410738-Alexandrium_andersonii.AAC.1
MGPPKAWQVARRAVSATGAPQRHGKCSGGRPVMWAHMVACRALPMAARTPCSRKVPSSTR